ncbi:MAG TPA: 3-carboxy-cis,cis-muconate cycloisomerase [Burkholderiaceae bacterium]
MSEQINSPRLHARLASTPAMEAIFSDRNGVQRMLDVEAALAVAEARHGVIPAAAVASIGAACKAELIDFAALAEAAAAAGNLAIPLVKQLTAGVAQSDAEAARYVHWGATSQDVIDTGMALQLREALAQIDADLRQLGNALSELAERHRATPQVGRTWMQQALPISFGAKVAGWLDALTRHHARLQQARTRSAVLQFGGAAGTLASLGDKGLQVALSLAAELKLGLPIMPWHAARDRFAEVAACLGLLTGTLGKIARDIALLSQTEIAELAEPAAPEGSRRGGSSAMPHKRNPVSCAAALAAAERVPHLVATMLGAMTQENERALGGWQAEWETLPQILRLSACALQQMLYVCSGLHVDAERMRHNLNLTRGQIMAEAVVMALGARIGRQAAYEVVERACRAASCPPSRHLRAVLEQDGVIGAHLSTKELDHAFDPANYTGVAAEFVDRAVAAWHAQVQQEH